MLTFYTVQIDKQGYPVKYCAPSEEYRIKTFAGPFSDPGEASQEFQASHGDTCYLDASSFQAKARALAQLRKSK